MSTEKEEERPQTGSSFRGQRTTSIMARLAREKAERVESSGTRNAAVLFSKDPSAYSAQLFMSINNNHAIEQKGRWWKPQFESRLEAWSGDLNSPRMGLGDLRWKRISAGPASNGAVDTIIYNEAIVHFRARRKTLVKQPV